jgi:asparagine synthase (glutamine-hydrolysing)
VALWDARQHRLVLARDRLGVRPLYLCEHAGAVYFASEVKAIFAADAGIRRAFDAYGIEQTFTFWSVVPPQSVFEGVEELRPGHVRVFEQGRVHEQRIWHSSYPLLPEATGQFKGTLDDAVDEVRRALESATSLRMLQADVPVGSYLSGGLDSSLVAALGRRFAGDRFHTFSLRFEDAEYDETEYQRQMVQMIGSDHHEVVVRRSDIAAVFPAVIEHTERPILRTAPAPLFLLSKLVRDHGIKVVLTGEGADEFFGGYDLFREGKVRRFWARQPDSRLRPRALERLYPYLARSPVWPQPRKRASPGVRPRHALEYDHRAQAALHRRDAGTTRTAGRRHRLSRHVAAGVFALAPARAGPVHRDPDAAVGLPAVVAGRPHADG